MLPRAFLILEISEDLICYFGVLHSRNIRGPKIATLGHSILEILKDLICYLGGLHSGKIRGPKKHFTFVVKTSLLKLHHTSMSIFTISGIQVQIKITQHL